MSFWSPIMYVIQRVATYYTYKSWNKERMRRVYEIDRYWQKKEKKVPIDLDESQKRAVKEFWDRYSFAYKNNIRTQKYFTYITGEFSPAYISEGLNAAYMYRFYDSPQYHQAFHDKNYRELLFGEEHCTKAVIRRISKYYFTGDRTPISYNAAIDLLAKVLKTEKKLIVKPTPGGGGSNIQFLRDGFEKREIRLVLDHFTKDDLIIEKILKSHSSYSVANSTSLNSLRIITLLYEHEVTVLAILFRMGAVGKEVDNFTQGGVACGVNLDGTCMDYGFDHFGNRYDRHPNGFEFAGHHLYGVDKAVEFCKNLHWRIPQFKQMSWDVAISEDGKPVLVEMNPRGEAKIYQSIGAQPYGKYTKQILDEYLILYFFNKGATLNWDYKEYNDHIALTKYCGNRNRIKIPSKIKGKTVTTVEETCFTGKKLKKITIPGCVKTPSSVICKNKDVEILQLQDTRGITVETPEDLNLTAFAGKNVLRWSAVEQATSYRIFRMEAGGKRQLLRAIVGTQTEFTDYNVQTGIRYYYYIRAHDSSCNITSEFSKAVSAVAR